MKLSAGVPCDRCPKQDCLVYPNSINSNLFPSTFGDHLEENIDEILKWYIEKIRKSFDPKYVVLFGSYSRGEQREFSDIDIAVVFDKYEGSNILEDNAFLFRLAWEVDSRIEPVILSLENDASGFAESVVKNGKILYAA